MVAVTYSCGYSFHDFSRAGDQLEQHQEPCPWHEQVRAMDLPSLQGSEKQRAWAERIRENALAHALAVIARIEGRAAEARRRGLAGVAERNEALVAQLRRAVELMRGEPRAAWWIDHRRQVEYGDQGGVLVATGAYRA